MDNDIIMRLRENLYKVQEKQASQEEVLQSLRLLVAFLYLIVAAQIFIFVCCFWSNVNRAVFFLPALLVNYVNSERTAYEPIKDSDNEGEDRDTKKSTGESEPVTEKSDKEATTEQDARNSGDQEKIEEELEACEIQKSENAASEERGDFGRNGHFEMEGIEELSKASVKNEDVKEAPLEKLEIKAKEESVLGFEKTVDIKE